MRLYHYAPKENTVLQTGLYSYSKHPRGLKRGYALPAKSDKKKDIIAWMETVFPGRSRAISCLTEPIKWRGNDNVLKGIVKRSVLVSFDLNDLIKAGIVESIWCRDDSVHKGRKYVCGDNVQSQKSISGSGFHLDGRIRASTMLSDGTFMDQLVFTKLKSEYGK